MLSEFLFKLLNGVGPVDRLGSLIVIGNVLSERGFQSGGTDKVIGLQQFSLKQAEPNLELIQPGRIERQPEDLKVQALITGVFLLTEPAFQLFGRMGGSVV